jgi:hypothetical protein
MATSGTTIIIFGTAVILENSCSSGNTNIYNDDIIKTTYILLSSTSIVASTTISASAS